MSVARLIATLGLLAGCLDPAEVVCGDGTVCPAGATCDETNHRCLAANAIAACAGSVDGASCKVAGADGSCQLGACIAFVCGDGVRNGGEDCDGADLGGKDCTAVGFSEAQGLACHGDCTFDTSGCVGRCGDGVRDGIEDCDGADLGGATCTTFGLHDPLAGTGLRCSADCTFDQTGCDGTCGDHILNGPEVCDGAPPAGTCLGDGFEAGGLVCTAGCAASTAACGRFGWQQLPAPQTGGGVGALWAVGNHEYYAAASQGLLHFANGAWVTVSTFAPMDVVNAQVRWIDARSPDDFDALVVDDGNLVPTVEYLEHFDGTSFTRLQDVAPLEPVAFVTAATDDHWLFSARAKIYHLDHGVLAELPFPGADPDAFTTVKPIRFAADDAWAFAVFSGVGGELLRFDGAAWSVVALPDLGGGQYIDFWASSSRDVWVLSNDARAARFDGATWQLLSIGADPAHPPQWIVGTGSDDVLAIGEHENATFDAFITTIRRWDGARFVAEPDLPLGVTAPSTGLATFAGEVMAESLNITGTLGFVLRGVADDWTVLSAPSLAPAAERPLLLLSPDDGYGLAGDQLLQWDGVAWSPAAGGAGAPLRCLWGGSDAEVWVGADGALLLWDGSALQPFALPGEDAPDIVALFGTSAGDVWASDANGPHMWHFDGTAWSLDATAPAATFTAIHASAPDDVWAVAGTVVAHFDGSTWSTIATSQSYDAVFASAPDDVWLAGDGVIAHWDGVAVSPQDVRAIDAWTELTGTAADDVFAIGHQVILHFDGVQWAPIESPPLAASDRLAQGAAVAHALLVTTEQPATAILLRHGRWACRASETSCHDGIDDDCDGLVDDADPDCAGVP